MPLQEKIRDYLVRKNFLTRETLLFSVLSVLLPNAVYIALSFFYCPYRTPIVVFLALVCMLGLFLPRAIFFVLLLAIMTIDALILISNFFQMPLPMLVDAMRYAGNVDLWNSAIYFAGFAALLASFVLTYLAIVKAKRNRAAINYVPFVVLLAVYASVDWWVNVSPQEFAVAEASVAESYVPINRSAVLASGLEERLNATKKRNVLVVVVEGLGAFASQELQDLIWQPLLEDDVAGRYDVKSGDTIYFGTTTAGEVRELCGLKGDYRDFRDRDSGDCLPRRAVEAGYRTASFHAFTGNFFERFDWYPKIGFQELNFRETNAGIETDGALPECGVAFRGLCDADVAGAVERFLVNGDGERKFAYWLTLNSHKPVPPGEVPPRFGCDEEGGVFTDVELCRMAEQWLNVSYLVKAIAMRDDLAETEIVLVGDHHPPLFTRRARYMFTPGEVAWIHLKPRGEQALAASYSGGRNRN
ncbi:sulfatase-like hydrolase/transferase [Roseibium sp.]|uniref:sulfatase-like hydrolase/transferase n=1 Tax=Roseibium sp. TaxID=1936156 RepID=UPI003D0AE5C0